MTGTTVDHSCDNRKVCLVHITIPPSYNPALPRYLSIKILNFFASRFCVYIKQFFSSSINMINNLHRVGWFVVDEFVWALLSASALAE